MNILNDFDSVYDEMDYCLVQHLQGKRNTVSPERTLYYRKYPLTSEDKQAIVEWCNGDGIIDENAIAAILFRDNNQAGRGSSRYLECVIKKEIRFRESIAADYQRKQQIGYWEQRKKEAEEQLSILRHE